MQQFLDLDTSSSIVGRVLRIREHMHLSIRPSSNLSGSEVTDASLSQQEHTEAVKLSSQIVKDSSYRCASSESCFIQAWEKLSIRP